MKSSEILSSEFYQRDTIDVARDLLGKELVRIINGKEVSGVIVETEAYLGAQDPACHTFGYRKTKRTETMFMSGGYSYVYFIYGMYNCFNVVSSVEGEPEAVLIRALEPRFGLEAMSENRRGLTKAFDLTAGPGKLCQALRITRDLDRTLLTTDDRLFIRDCGQIFNGSQIHADERVGIGYANDAVHWPLRFSVKDHPCVSKA